MRDTGNAALSEPPEGAIVGESVPRENERGDRERQAIEAMMGALKTRPEFHDWSESELREEAVDRLQKTGVIR